MSRIAVLCGGSSREREVSLCSGRNVYESLKRLGYEAVTIDPEENMISGLEQFDPDLVFLALHGTNGEDGNIQGLLSFLGYSFTGSGVFASSMCMNKVACKKMLIHSGIRTPDYRMIGPELDRDRLQEILSMQFPVVAKPVAEGSSIGVEIIKKKDHFENTVSNLIRKFGDYFVEEYIRGTEITVSVIGSGSRARVLPLLELVPKKEFYDYEAKYTKGLTEFVIPARIPERSAQQARDFALTIFRDFGLRGFARIDMLISERDVSVIDVNTIPGMTDTSDLPASAAADGMDFDQVVDFIVRDALGVS